MTHPIDKAARGATSHEPEQSAAEATRTYVIGPYSSARRVSGAAPRDIGEQDGLGTPDRSTQARLDEAVGLARAIDLDVRSAMIVPLRARRPSTYLGEGKVEELGGMIKAEEVGLVVADCALSPVQQRNLEKAWGCKVIDRTGLILEIFGRRARTKEGTIQVELAHLGYQKSRLVRSWTHLERQRGGFGFLGGPGETQIETDRRIIQERMTRLERDLETVKRTRGLHRANRQRVPYPIVALVGYTNAGKSTLFNHLTQADVLAEDLLFATLDPTARAVKLPHGSRVVLSDTVGFISDLPTTLIAAFRATLEDVIAADIILHIRDVSHEDTTAQAANVEGILRDLGVDPAAHAGEEGRGRLIEVWNKLDLLTDEDRQRVENLAALHEGEDAPALISALTGDGVDGLLRRIEDKIAQGRPLYRVTVGASDGAKLGWLHDNTEVMERQEDEDGGTRLVVRVGLAAVGRLLHLLPQAQREG